MELERINAHLTQYLSERYIHRGVASIYAPTPVRTAEIRDFFNDDDAKTLSFARFYNPLFFRCFNPSFLLQVAKNRRDG